MACVSGFVSLNDRSVFSKACQTLDRERLQTIIDQWNSERLDLFEISQPDEDLNFHGVMRFYLQDHITGNFSTKCIRVSSTSTTQEVIATLLEKFKLDIKAEADPYFMYEVSGDKEGRRLDLHEQPLMVQLSWNKDTIEGRFILKNDGNTNLQNNGVDGKEKVGVLQNFKRTLSKKHKTNKQKKKENLDSHCIETGDLPSDGINCKNSHEQEKRTLVDDLKAGMNPADPECFELRNEEIKSEHSNRKPSSSTVRPAGKVVCSEQSNKRRLLEYITQKREQTSESWNGSNGSTVPENSVPKWNLPLSIKLGEKKEEAFLLAVVNYTNSSTVHFKLSPAYAFYLACRFVLTQSEERNKNPKKTAQRISTIVNKIVRLMDNVIQKQRSITVALTFWMANASEFLNFIRQDSDLANITISSQNALGQLVQKAFKYLSNRLLADLESHLPGFVTDAGDETTQAGIDSVLASFSRAMTLLRRFRVNPALSIQLFSQLFHFMGAWLLNRLTVAASGSNLCSHYWGMTLRQQLNHVEAWAERQGLELAADCHLSRIIQATTLLTLNSYGVKNAEKVHSVCFKLNSLQLRALMTKYQYAPKQPHIPHDLIESVVAMAESEEKDVLEKEGTEIKIEEDLQLHLPFLLPEEGYSCEILQGVPQGFREFLEPICQKGLCTLIPHQLSLGSWTVHFQTSDLSPGNRVKCKPAIVKITLKKPSQSGMGISIVAAKGAGQEKLGIFIKSVVRGGAADVDGRLTPGDQLLSVQGKSLIGMSQERAAEIMLCTGSSVTLEIAKLAAVYYGLEEVLNQPSQSTFRDGDIAEQATQPSSGLDMSEISGQIVCAPSTIPSTKGSYHTVKRPIRRQDQQWLKHRLEYRSNPNLAYPFQTTMEMSVDSFTHNQIFTSVSTDNLIAGRQPESGLSTLSPGQTGSYREYSTLPVSRLQASKESRTAEQAHVFSTVSHCHDPSVKLAHSQETLPSMDKGGPLVDRPLYFDSWSGQQQSVDSNFSGQERRSKDGQWEISGHSLHVSQPKRIDVPVSHPTNAFPFGMSQQPVLRADTTNTSLSSTTNTYGQVRNPQRTSAPGCYHLEQYTGSALASKQLVQSRVSPQKPKLDKFCEKPQAVVCQSFSKSHDKKSKISSSQLSDTTEPHSYKPVMKGDVQGLSPDIWKREAQEQLKKQQRHLAVDLLVQEMLQLQGKMERTLEESERLRRLSLEWQFQKRLQDFQQNGEDNDEEEDEHNSAVIMQQLEPQSNEQPNAADLYNGQQLSERQNQLPLQQKCQQTEEDCLKDAGPGGSSETNKTQRVSVYVGQLNHKNFKNTKAPENLTFRERQQLFSLTMNEPNKVKIS
uniref:Afadin, adherens junction formation factor a n=1 Tax=Astyanax mexicanus TaxID=7994 RepID=A0A8B9H7G8_ASTMX